MNSIIRFFLGLVIFTGSVSLYGQSPVKVILDTDIDSDVDDVGALAMLHTLMDHRVVDILGVIVTSDDKYAPLCTDALNQYFNRPDIPIGVQKGVPLREFSKYTKEISEEFEHDLQSYHDAEDATTLYRKLLSSQPDSSVVIITIGHLTNLSNLLKSSPDKYSNLSGIDLVRKKVKLWSCMGGKFPEGKEANFYRPDPGSTVFSLDKWPGRVVFAGWEIGNEIITGGDYLRKTLAPESPVYRAYELYNNFEGRASWDQASVLYAVLDSNDYWCLTEGEVLVSKDGSNTWIPSENSNQAYLVKKMDPNEVAKIIDALMTGLFSSRF